MIMRTKTIRLGNAVIAFESDLQLDWGGKLADFRTEEPVNYTVSVRCAFPGEETPHAGGYAKVLRDGNRFLVVLREQSFPELTIWQVLSKLPVPQLLMEQDTFILHASFILCEGQAILFSGPSGIGKSTQADLWCRYRNARLVNGDRVLLMPGTDNCLVASHYLSGTSGVCENAVAPLNAIVFLGQSPDNRVREMRPVELFRTVISQLDYDVRSREQIEMVTSMVEKLTAQTKICQYSCRMDESAVVDLEKYLYEELSDQNDTQR